TAAPPADERRPDPNIERHARRLIRIDPAAGKSFAEFAGFDLSIDDQTTAAVGHVRESIAQTDAPLAQLRLLLQLVRLEPNPAASEAFLRRSMALFAELERSSRQKDVATLAWQP